MATIDQTTGVRSKERSEEDFTSLYQCDRFEATVLANRYRYIVQHMCTGLLNTAFSTILRDWYDFAATISGPPEMNYPLPAMSNSLVLFLGTMADANRNVIEEYGVENLEPGDVIMCNDPYRTGTHVNDVDFIRPAFHEGKIIGFLNLQAHMLDIGGVVPAGFSGTKRNVYENGLVISPTALFRGDKPIRSAWSLIFDNARFAGLLQSDITSIYQNLVLGERLLVETFERYGTESCLGAMRYACDISAETMRDALTELPDGDYEGTDKIDCDGQDDDEEFRVKVKIRKRGGRAEIDLSGTSRQARTSINAGWLDAKTAIGVALKYLIDPKTPFTSAAYRDIDILIPPGSMVNALPPDGAIFLYWESTNPLLTSIFIALRDALGEEAVGGDHGSLAIHNANGVAEDGTPWVTMAQCGGEHGPWGATKDGDADSYMVFYQANNIDPATEAIEADFPVLLMRKEYAPDTGGAGYNRGGNSMLKDTFWTSDAEHYSMPLHVKGPTGVGVNGGEDGGTGAVWVFEPDADGALDGSQQLPLDNDVYKTSTPVAGVLDPETKAQDLEGGEYFYFARVPIWNTKPGTSFRYITNGGGGWGNPLEREAERVMRDVRDGYVTIEGAKRLYAVAVTGDPESDPEGLEIDQAETEKLRSAAKG